LLSCAFATKTAQNNVAVNINFFIFKILLKLI
jgi:hypothetical protein